jgi:hypothetical protein
VQQVGHAVQVLRAEEGHARPPGARGQLPVHAQFGGQRRKLGLEGLQVKVVRRGRAAVCKTPFDAHEEEAQPVVLVLVGVQNVGPMPVEQRGDAGHQTPLVRAVNQQNGGIFHTFFSLIHRLRHR